MPQFPGTQSAPQRTPLSAEEKARAEANFSPYVAEALAARGRFRVSADTPRRLPALPDGTLGTGRRFSPPPPTTTWPDGI